MRAFSHAWSFSVTRQRWRSHHSIHHIQKPHARPTCKLHQARRTGVIADRSFTLREANRDFRLFCSCHLDLDPMTFIHELDPYSLDIPDVQIWTSYVKAFDSYRLTDWQKRRNYTTPLCWWSKRFNIYGLHSVAKGWLDAGAPQGEN